MSRCALYFHRAFDDVIQPEYALEQLMALGFDGVLTSGQRTTALEGIDKLTQWKQMADGKLVVMPGSGINAANFQHFQEAGFKWIHLSSKKIMPMTSSSSSLFSAPQYGIDIIALNKLIERVKSNPIENFSHFYRFAFIYKSKNTGILNRIEHH